MNSICLNCNQPTEKNYCSTCSQKTATHRFSLQHFFVHDLVHGLFHVDKGFLYTIKELFTRPGHSIREYVQGKRANHFNYFAAVILILAIDHFISGWMKVEFTELYSKESISGLTRVAKDFSKIVTFLGVPFFALYSYVLFRKSKQNYSENLVLNMYLLCGWLCMGLLQKVTMLIPQPVSVSKTINWVFVGLLSTYVLIFYYQYFSAFGYKKASLIARVVVITYITLWTRQLLNDGLNEIGLRYFH